MSTVFHHPSNNPNDRTHFKAEHLIVSLSPAYLDFTHGTVTDLQCCFYATVSFDNHRQTSQRSFLSSTKKFHASLHKIITYTWLVNVSVQPSKTPSFLSAFFPSVFIPSADWQLMHAECVKQQQANISIKKVIVIADRSLCTVLPSHSSLSDPARTVLWRREIKLEQVLFSSRNNSVFPLPEVVVGMRQLKPAACHFKLILAVLFTDYYTA